MFEHQHLMTHKGLSLGTSDHLCEWEKEGESLEDVRKRQQQMVPSKGITFDTTLKNMRENNCKEIYFGK